MKGVCARSSNILPGQAQNLKIGNLWTMVTFFMTSRLSVILHKNRKSQIVPNCDPKCDPTFDQHRNLHQRLHRFASSPTLPGCGLVQGASPLPRLCASGQGWPLLRRLCGGGWGKRSGGGETGGEIAELVGLRAREGW